MPLIGKRIPDSAVPEDKNDEQKESVQTQLTDGPEEPVIQRANLEDVKKYDAHYHELKEIWDKRIDIYPVTVFLAWLIAIIAVITSALVALWWSGW